MWKLRQYIQFLALLVIIYVALIAHVTAQTPQPVDLGLAAAWNDTLTTIKADSLAPDAFKKWRDDFQRLINDSQHDNFDPNSEAAKRIFQRCEQSYANTWKATYRVKLFGGLDSLMHTNQFNDARRYAPTIHKRAYDYREKAVVQLQLRKPEDLILQQNLAAAKYEASHAIAIMNFAQKYKGSDSNWEQLALRFEELLRNSGNQIKAVLRFDSGLTQGANDLSSAVGKFNDSLKTLSEDRKDLEKRLLVMCNTIGVPLTSGDSLESILPKMEEEFQQLVRELDAIRQESRLTQERLTEIREEHQTTTTILQAKEEREQRFNSVKALFTPEEALTLTNASGDIVIRLRGIVFPTGVTQVMPQHLIVLDKVAQALQIYSTSRVIVEGHTDNTGTDEANKRVSQKRAEAVKEYLVEKINRDESEFEAIGYGPEKPVANNANAAGRAENRRIDIVIVR